MAAWPTLTDLEDQLQTAGLTGQKAMVAQAALNAASEWIAERCDLYQRDAYDVYVVDGDGYKVYPLTIPGPIHQAILLYAAKFYRRKDSPDGVTGSAENGLIRTGRYDSDAESLLAPYTTFTIG